jgi:hypothetical protein
MRFARSTRHQVAVVAVVLSVAAGASTAMAGTPDTRASSSVGHKPAWQAKTHPIYLPTLQDQWRRTTSERSDIDPPAPPCPESGKLPGPFSNCGLPEFPAVGQPYPGNMAWWGGHVQVKPKIYLVLWGWGRPGAFDADCAPERIVELSVKVTLRCDPDGTGKLMADFISQLGGTDWAGVQTQYYQGAGQHITNPKNQLGGIWVDDSSNLDKNRKHVVPTGPGGAFGTADDGGGIGRQFAQEAARAVVHFHVNDLLNTQFVIAQPKNFSDPAAGVNYCAWHDYTQPVLENHWYDGIKPGISFTNMPYLFTAKVAASCGAGLVNQGARKNYDPVTIALGHEIEETVTDPGAEDILPNGTAIGGWYDPFDANENGDKCAYVGSTFVSGVNTGEPGSAANIRGNRGSVFPVQSLWSNQAAEGVGWCAGAGTDVPLPNG